MPRLAIYHDANSGNHAMRVTKDVADAPWAVAITDYGKMHFDSLNPNQVSPIGMYTYNAAYVGPVTAWNGGQQLWPIGSSNATALGVTSKLAEFDVHPFCLAIGRVSNWGTPRIIKSFRIKSDGYFVTNTTYDFVVVNTGNYIIGTVATITSFAGYATVWTNSAKVTSNYAYSGGGSASYYGGISGYTGYYLGSQYSLTDSFVDRIVIWPMPALNESFTPVSQTITSGNKFAKLSNEGVKIARPGFDVETATSEQLLMSSDASPILLVATGETTVNAGATVNINLPSDIAYDEDMLVDTIVTKTGQTNTYYPLSFEGDPAYGTWSGGVDIKVVPVPGGTSYVSIRSTATINVSVRYLVFRYAGNPSTIGSGTILKGTSDAIQILRPGAATPPAVDDVLFDTRFPYCPIVAEGYWAVSALNNAPSPVPPQTHTVNLTNTGGWKPYPVWMAIDTYGRILSPITEIIAGRNQQGQFSVWHGQFSSRTTRAKITDTQVVFEAYSQHPTRTEASFNQWGVGWYPQPMYDPSRVYAIRYYIFAIPT